MQRGQDIARKHPDIFIVHHNLPDSNVAAHSHPEHHLIIPLQGEVTVTLKTETFLCGPGRMIYIAPMAEHAFRSSRQKGERLICMIDDKAWPRHLGSHVNMPSKLLPTSQLIKELLFHMLLQRDNVHTAALLAALNSVLHDMLQAAAPDVTQKLLHADAKLKRPELVKACKIATEDFASLTVKTWAKRSGLSERNFVRLFSDELGMTPKQCLIALKVEHAKELLANHASVTEAAYAVGYDSLSQFIAVFRQVTGCLPSNFIR